MRGIGIGLALLALGTRLAAVAQLLPAASAVLSHNPTPAERAWVASTIYHIVKRYFAHWEGLPAGFDFDARFKSYLAEAMSAPDRRAFSLATMRSSPIPAPLLSMPSR